MAPKVRHRDACVSVEPSHARLDSDQGGPTKVGPYQSGRPRRANQGWPLPKQGQADQERRMRTAPDRRGDRYRPHRWTQADGMAAGLGLRAKAPPPVVPWRGRRFRRYRGARSRAWPGLRWPDHAVPGVSACVSAWGTSWEAGFRTYAEGVAWPAASRASFDPG